MGVQINLDDTMHRWRWTCPNGHRNWEPTNNHFWCQACARLNEDPVFHELHDKRAGKNYDRDDLELVTDCGPYHEVYGEEGAP